MDFAAYLCFLQSCLDLSLLLFQLLSNLLKLMNILSTLSDLFSEIRYFLWDTQWGIFKTLNVSCRQIHKHCNSNVSRCYSSGGEHFVCCPVYLPSHCAWEKVPISLDVTFTSKNNTKLSSIENFLFPHLYSVLYPFAFALEVFPQLTQKVGWLRPCACPQCPNHFSHLETESIYPALPCRFLFSLFMVSRCSRDSS